jgi:probable HAF family extracellular repeat protein
LSYTVTDLSLLGRVEGPAYGINAAGEVVGWAGRPRTGPTHAFLYDGSVMNDLGTLTGDGASFGTGVNDASPVEVVGISSGAGGDRAFLWQDGVMTDLGTLGGAMSGATGINNAGEVVGGSDFVGGQFGQSHAFLYRDGVMTDLGTLGGTFSYAYGINNEGDVVGTAATDYFNVVHPFLYQDGQMMDLGSLGGSGYAYGINDVGQVVGFSVTTTGDHAFLWDNTNGMQDLGTLGGNTSTARGINNFGQVVGSTGTGAFLYSDGVMTDLNTLIPPDSGLFLYTAYGINDAGQIVGGATGPDHHTHAFLLTPDGNSAPRHQSLTSLRVSDPLQAAPPLASANALGTDDRQAFPALDRRVAESAGLPGVSSDSAGDPARVLAGGRAPEDLLALPPSDWLNAPVLEELATNL